MTILIDLHLASTWLMVGLIWLVQIVHYPLMGLVGTEQFPAYERHHVRRITWVVGPGMLLESGSGVLLFLGGLDSPLFLTSLALLLVIWTSTAFLQVPLHTALGKEFSSSVLSRLVLTNWIRTLAWTVRGLILLLVF